VNYSALSLWHETTPTDWSARRALSGEVEVDVAIVGAGFTGLWTAYYLSRARPEMRIAIVEAEVAGFGASGRNGGWCSALFPVDLGDEQAAVMRATVDEVLRIAAEEGIDCHAAKSGTISLIRNRAQLKRVRASGAHVLTPAQTAQHVRASRVLGSTFTPDCAVIHPARLVRGLADVVARRSVTIYEKSPVLRVQPGEVRTAVGTVRAKYVVRATEGFTPKLPRLARAIIPVYSLMVATEPLSEATWDRIGLASRPTFTEQRHRVSYGQRTADDRLVLGGRGAPYHLGSKVAPGYDRAPRVFAKLQETVIDLFPALDKARFTHAWGGPLGISRDWHPSVGLDRTTGMAWAGGYVGDGVSTTNLAGRTLADLILSRNSRLVRLPWVDHKSPLWEPEPLRWVGVNAGLRAMTMADAEERFTGRPSLIARAMAPLIGH
jgi:glycine/D-amino acid oxidase-like deaminating enzyme